MQYPPMNEKPNNKNFKIVDIGRTIGGFRTVYLTHRKLIVVF